ncbi:DinB family protein [Jatrophihabitans sp. YIM 134969]
MTETQRQPVPRVDTGERETALAFLRFARESVLKKLDGVDDDDLRRELVPSGTNLLGLVQHLAASEWYWFGYTFGGEDLGAPHDDRYFSMTVPPEVTTGDVVRAYRSAWERSDAIVTAAADLEQRTAEPVDGRPMSLRWVLAHMTSETARHAGHADILRELIDGVTGR